MPQAYPYIIEAIGEYVGPSVLGVVLAVAVTVLEKALTKKGGSGSLPINVTVRSTVAPRKIALGTRRLSGSIVFVGLSGTNNKFLWYVVAWSGHQCSALKDLYLDTRKIPAADINGSTGVVSTASLNSKLKCWDHLGTSAQAVDSNLDADFTEFSSTSQLKGICYSALRFERDDKAWPQGAPQNVNRVTDGALLYDPRLDSTNGGSGSHRRTDPSTWAFSRNWALVNRWLITGGSIHNDTTTRLVRYGIQETDARVDDAYIIAAANISDQSLSGANAPPSGAQVRYTLDGEFSCDQPRREILEAALMPGGPGQWVYVKGKWRLYAGAYDSPLYTFTQDDLVEAMDVDDTSADADRFNQISGVFIDAAQDYTEQTTQVRSNAAYVTQDNGEEIAKDPVDLQGVTDQYRAQRIIERMLRQSRQMRGVTLPFGRQAMRVAPWETFTFTHSKYAWSKVFRCLERSEERNDTGGVIVRLKCRQEAASVDTDLLTADYTSGTSVANSLQSALPDAPSALTATARAGAILFSWTMPGTFWEQNGIVELWEAAHSAAFNTATRIWFGRGSTVSIEKADTTQRDYWVRITTVGNLQSATEPASSGLAASSYFPVIATPVTDAPADGNVTYTAGTQPRVEGSGLSSHITYTSPSGVDTRCVVNYSAQANISTTTSGVAVGYSSIKLTIQVNSVTVFTRETRIEANLSGSDSWGQLTGSKSIDVPAGQAIDVFFTTGRTFSTGGSSPAQTHNWRAAHVEILPTKQA